VKAICAPATWHAAEQEMLWRRHASDRGETASSTGGKVDAGEVAPKLGCRDARPMAM